jgi:hypothetical protein
MKIFSTLVLLVALLCVSCGEHHALRECQWNIRYSMLVPGTHSIRWSSSFRAEAGLEHYNGVEFCNSFGYSGYCYVSDFANAKEIGAAMSELLAQQCPTKGEDKS